MSTYVASDLTPPSAQHEQIDQLYSQQHHWLHSWLCKKLGCSYQAADVAQDTFTRLLSLSQLPSIIEPRAYLSTTATRLIIDQARRKKVEQHYLEHYSFYQDIERIAPSAEELLIITETLTAIVHLLEDLPEKCQRAFLMSRLDGMRHAEIATELGVSTSMVKQYMAKTMVHCYQLTYGAETAHGAATVAP